MMARSRFLLSLSLLLATAAAPLGLWECRAAPPASVPALPDPSVTQTGWLGVIWTDDGEHACLPSYWLMDGRGANLRLELTDELVRSLGRLTPPAGRRVTVTGDWDGNGTLVARSMAAIPDRSAPHRILAASTGNKPYVTILVRFSDSPALTPQPKSYYQGMMGESFPSLGHYWREQSYDQLNIQGGIVVGWYNLPHPKSYYTDPSDLTGMKFAPMMEDATAAADADVDFTRFYGINVMTNDSIKGGGNGGIWMATLDGRTGFWGATVNQALQTQGLLAHEMGHSLGMDHSSGPYGQVYDSHWDQMSSGYFTLQPDPGYGSMGVHTNSFHKEQVGWIPRARNFYALPGTNATFDLERLAQPVSTSSPLMATIFIGGSATDYYTVEARRFAGYDAQNGIPGEAVVIHRVDLLRQASKSQVVDPDGNGNPNDAGAMWLPGETFTDAANGISVRVNQMAASSFNVTITVDSSVPWPDVVTNTKDSGGGSLRSALYYANLFPGTTIRFRIPKSDPGYSSGVFTLSPPASLPGITGSGTVLDGTTQTAFGGDTNPAGPEILIRGSSISQWANGLTVQAAKCLLKGIAVGGFQGSGIWIDGASGGSASTVQGTYLGTDATGAAALPNATGVLITGGSQNNLIGGTTSDARNVLSGNKYEGVFCGDAGTTGNLIQGNYIGTSATGKAPLANASGIGVARGARNNTVGGTAAGTRNVISGNTYNGVYYSDGSTTGNFVQGNYIGTDPDGSAALPNGTGIAFYNGAQANTVGGATSGARNVISGNTYNGVVCVDAGTTGNLIQGNYIGTNAAGTAAVPNSSGIGFFNGAKANTAGGTSSGARNVISGNTGGGVVIGDSGTNANLVQGNYIGTTPTGTAALSNGGGVSIFRGAQNNVVGGAAPGTRNLISGNKYSGVSCADAGTTGNLIQGNYIGTNAAGTAALGNEGGVSFFSGAQGNVAGGTAAGAGNVIAGSKYNGVYITDAATSGNLVQGNFIGTDASGAAALSNSWGVAIVNGAHDNTVGGTASGAGNLISGNTGAGVGIGNSGTNNNLVQGNSIGANAAGTSGLPNDVGVTIYDGARRNVVGTTSAGAGNRIRFNKTGITLYDAGTTGNTIRGNAISSSQSLGINLGGSDQAFGVTPNDAGDADTGPNGLQNFPVLVTPTRSGDTLTVTGTLSSQASRTYDIDVYGVSTADPSGYGEGEQYLGSTSVTTNSSGQASLSLNVSWPLGLVTATATDHSSGDTSEFSATVAGPAAPGYTLTPSVGSVVPGGALSISWTASTPAANHWIALFKAGDPNTAYVWYRSTGGAASGTLNLTAPSKAGDYEFRYMLDSQTAAATSSKVTVTPGYTLTPSASSVSTGAALTISWTAAAPASNHWIGLFKVGDPNTAYVWYKSTGGAASGSINLTAPLKTGDYEFRYMLSSQTVAVTSSKVTVAPGYTLTPSASSVTAGTAISISWTTSAPAANHWIGLFKIGDPNSAYVWYKSTGGAATGTLNLTAPLKAGDYEFRYMLDSQTAAATSSKVTVTQGYTLTPSPTTVAAGGALSIGWTAATPASNHWIGLFKVGDPNTAYVWYRSTGGAGSGTFNLTAPKTTGQYEFRYMLTSQTVAATSAPVKVQ